MGFLPNAGQVRRQYEDSMRTQVGTEQTANGGKAKNNYKNMI